jgi:uncharacterized protein
LPAQLHRQTLTPYFIFTWLHLLTETAPFFRDAAPAMQLSLAYAFHLLTWIGYSAIYLLPTLLLTRMAQHFWPTRHKLIIGIALSFATLSLLLIRIDRTIFDLYNFHFNDFVLNLLLTPGGIDSLGGGSDSYMSSAVVVASIALIQLALWIISVPIASRIHFRPQKYLIAAFSMVIVAAQLSYGIGDLRNDANILDSADHYPLFLRVRFRGLAHKFGYQPAAREPSIIAKIDSSRLKYPLHPMQYNGITRPLNIVWLVAESLRVDQLDPQIMPNSFAFSRRGQNFRQHYSSGNGTREGLFGMFYGLYGSYWNNFLHANQEPVLLDRMQALNYQMDIRTSARFSYPEFDKTLFEGVPKSLLHEDEFKEDAWQRDRDNTSALIDFIRKREPSKPFLTFLFYESTHARYTFPDEAIIRKPYLQAVDYTEMSRAKLAPFANQLRNRYSNSAHWVDIQLGRIYKSLEQQHLLDNTVVIVTGDHGEEFMEKGFWGHNSSFVEEQTRPPLIVWMPGKPHRDIQRITSHMDIAVTLLQMLGASNDIGDYALGRNLFDESPRDFVVVSDWHSIAVVADDFKYRIPYTSRGRENYKPAHRNDRMFASSAVERTEIEEHQKIILEAARNLTKFAK